MATLTIRNIDEKVKDRLRMRAARNGRSMEAELRHLVTKAVGAVDTRCDLATAIHRRFVVVGGVEDLQPHPSVPVGDPPQFDL